MASALTTRIARTIAEEEHATSTPIQAPTVTVVMSRRDVIVMRLMNSPATFRNGSRDLMNCRGTGRKPIMFKILELKGNSTQAAEVGRRHPRREEALAAVKKHLKTF